MEGKEQQTIEIPTSKLLEALLHTQQIKEHYATQESVDNLKERMNEKFDAMDKRFEQVDKRFEQVDKRFDLQDRRIDGIEKKIDRLQWLIVSTALLVLFKDQLFSLFA